MTVWLMPAPAAFEAFFFTCAERSGLGPIVDELRRLRLAGTLRSVMHIGNDYKVLAASGTYPWEETGGRTPLDRATMEGLRRKLKIAPWTGSGGLYGTVAQVRDAKRHVRQALSGKVERLQFVDDQRLRFAKQFAKPLDRFTSLNLGRTLDVATTVYDLLRGVPTNSSLASAYWRKRTPLPESLDPDRDGCGLLWCSPVLPATGDDATTVTQLAEKLVLAHGFEPQMSLSVATERILICVITISYDRGVPGEDERAWICYQRLTEELIEHGYPPYRLNVGAMASAHQEGDYGNAVRAIKSALDPHAILAPGRYDGPRSTS